MADERGEEVWSMTLRDRIQLYQSQIHAGDTSCLSEARKTLETLQHIVTELASCVNTAGSPISRLSPEILSLVFHFLSYELPIAPRYIEYGNDSTEDEYRDPTSTWIKVTHVSRYWREVALGDSSLWTNISMAHGAYWAKALLKRSGTRRILLQLADNAPGLAPGDTVWKEAGLRAHTIQSGRNGQTWMQLVLGDSARSLFALRARMDVDPHNAEGRMFSTSFLGSDYDPATLRELELCGFLRYDWRHLVQYPALTSIKMGILNSQFWAAINSLADEFFIILSQLHMLQSLVLMGFALGDTGLNLEEYADAVYLPSLKLLRLESCHPNTLICLFNAIAVPASASVQLVAKHDWWTQSHDDIRSSFAFLGVLRRRLSAPAWNAFRALVVSAEEDLPKWMQYERFDNCKSVSFLAWRTDVDPHELLRHREQGGPLAPEPDFYFRAPYSSKLLAPADYSIDILDLFKHVQIETLCVIPGPKSISILHWNRISGIFPALRHMVTCDQLSVDMTVGIYLDCLGASATTKSAPIQRLTFLSSSGRNLFSPAPLPFQDSGPGVLVTYAHLLERICQIRSEHGLAVKVFIDNSVLPDKAGGVLSDRSTFQRVSLYRVG